MVTRYTCSGFDSVSRQPTDIGLSAHLMAVRIATGQLVAGPKPLPRSYGVGLAVFGEWRAAVNPPPSPPPSRRRAAR